MKTQVGLFEKLITHKNDPETSFAAAEKMVESGALSRQEEDVWGAIRDYISMLQAKTFTARELSDWCGFDYCFNYYTIQRRLSGLRAKGRIDRIQIGVKPDGKPIYKKRNGCAVWRIVGAKL